MNDTVSGVVIGRVLWYSETYFIPGGDRIGVSLYSRIESLRKET